MPENINIPDSNITTNLTFRNLILMNMQQLTNFPYIENDFDALTDYELLCLVVKYLNDVISNQNEQNTSITNIYNSFLALQNYVNNSKDEIEDAFNELNDYVANYFNNLDVQEEINNKLDGLVDDGTMQTLVNNYAQPILDSLTAYVNQTADEVNDLANNVGTIVGDLRKKYYDKYHLFQLPTTLNSWFNQVTIYESIEKENYKIKYDEESLKNTGGDSVYVDCNYTGSSTGTSEQPYKTLQDAFNLTNDGDTIILKEGIYRREKLPAANQVIKNVNLIGEGNVLLTSSSELTWTQNETYTNVYQASRSNSTAVIDVRDMSLPIGLIQTSSISECASTLGSYYTDNSVVYVNIGEEVTNDKIVVSLALGYSSLNFAPKNNKDLKIYMENITCLNGHQPIVEVSSTASYDTYFGAKNCRFLYGQANNTKDGINLLGSKSFMINCEASFNGKDGFNYHAYNGKVCYGIEIDCIATCNGLGRTDEHTYNGSTAHDGSQIMRIRGNYLKNNGSNVADVNENTISINIECNAFDSTANTDNIYDSDFCTQQSGAVMYIYNCFAKGYSYKNLFATTNSTIYVSNCNYDSSEGNIVTI